MSLPKLFDKIAIDFEDFVLRGKFDYVELGMTRDQILQVLPRPELSDKLAIEHSTIWRYGELELFFDPASGRLTRIFSDYVSTLDGGETFDVSTWILSERLELSSFLDVLNQAQVDYQVTHSPALEASVVEISDSGVELSFSIEPGDVDARRRKLGAVWKAELSVARRLGQAARKR